MTMDISNQNKLSEFYEELKRLDIKINRPDINVCFADFRNDDKKFYYALGGIKAVGFEAISNIIKERLSNGKFCSIYDFIKRVNPKDINKLQLEGLVKAGAFDSINKNRLALFNSIPSLITKSKNIFENKSANQIDLFNNTEDDKEDFIPKIDDWMFEESLSKEFEAVGFFIYENETNDSNIAATLLKVQERKTSKGNAYAILKLTDLTSVFELFIFSEILETNRNILKEGNSLILTLAKSVSDENNRFKRVNVKKIISLKDVINVPIKNASFKLNSLKDLDELSKFLIDPGNTNISVEIVEDNKILYFKLKNGRNLDRKTLNLIRNKEISAIIN